MMLSDASTMSEFQKRVSSRRHRKVANKMKTKHDFARASKNRNVEIETALH